MDDVNRQLVRAGVPPVDEYVFKWRMRKAFNDRKYSGTFGKHPSFFFVFGGRSVVNRVAAAKKAAGKSTRGSAGAEVEVEVPEMEMERCARPYDPVRDV
jgi:hypothetical protein